MKELLLSKGFVLNEYDTGNCYEYIREDIDDEVRSTGKLFGFDEDYISEEFVLQCDESFKNCMAYADGNSYYLHEYEFFDAVKSMKNV